MGLRLKGEGRNLCCHRSIKPHACMQSHARVRVPVCDMASFSMVAYCLVPMESGGIRAINKDCLSGADEVATFGQGNVPASVFPPMHPLHHLLTQADTLSVGSHVPLNCRIFAPALYIFFASALPAFAFGQQLSEETDGTLTVVHVLAATAISGTLQVERMKGVERRLRLAGRV